MKLKVTETFEKLNRIIDAGYKNVVKQGSTSSGKTFAAYQTLILLGLKSEVPIKISTIRRTRVTLERTAFGESGDFQRILTNMGMWDENLLNKSSLTYKIKNAQFNFLGLDNAAGRQAARGDRADIHFIDEINEMDWEIVRQIMLRNRQLFIANFNPSVTSSHWLYSWLCRLKDEKTGKPLTKLFISTFRDNKFADPKSVQNIRSYEPTEENIKNGTADDQYWKIFGLGQRCALEGLIYPETKRKKIEEWPTDVPITAYGMDFGFSEKGDPTTLIQVGYGKDKDLGKLYVKELMYQKGLYIRHNPNDPKNDSVEKQFAALGVDKRIPIYADSEDPLAIKEIKALGYNIIGVAKPKGSVKDGIEQARKFSMRIVDPSENLWQELGRYKWRVSKDGIQLGEPTKGWDHCCIAKGQLILTDKGSLPVEKIKSGDMVMTRGGWRPVLKQWLARTETEVWKLETVDGLKIIATPDHKIFTTNRGFVPLCNLTKHDTLLKSRGSELINTLVGSIHRLATKFDTYDLTIDDPEFHEFVAGNILVKNCDPLRYIVMNTDDQSGFAIGAGGYCETFKWDNGSDKWDERSEGPVVNGIQMQDTRPQFDVPLSSEL